MGCRREAERIARQLEEARGNDVSCQSAGIQAALGNRARALDLLEICYTTRASSFKYIGVDARFDTLRAEPRLKALMVRARLP